MALARTSALTPSWKVAKFASNRPASSAAPCGHRRPCPPRPGAGRARRPGCPGTPEGIIRPNTGSAWNLAWARLPSSTALQQRPRVLDGHALADAIGAAGPAGVHQPAIGAVFLDQARPASCRRRPAGAAGTGRRSRWRRSPAPLRPSPFRCRPRGRCSRSGNGTSPGPADSLAIGGSTPNASAVSMTTFFGWPPRPEGSWFSTKCERVAGRGCSAWRSRPSGPAGRRASAATFSSTAPKRWVAFQIPGSAVWLRSITLA